MRHMGFVWVIRPIHTTNISSFIKIRAVTLMTDPYNNNNNNIYGGECLTSVDSTKSLLLVNFMVSLRTEA